MKKYGKMSKIVIFWQNVKMVLFDVFEEFVYGINVENVIFCRIYMVEMWISWSWRIKRIIFTNNMIEVGSIMTVDLLISDKPSVSKLCGYRLHSVSPSLDQLPWASWLMSLLLTRQAGHDSGELCLVFQALPSLYEGHRCLHAGGTCTCRDRGGAVSLGPGPNEDSTWWEEWDFQKIHAGTHQHNHDLLWFSWIFSIGDGDEVRHNKINIDSLYSCTDEQRKRPLTWRWVVLGVCGVLWFRCSHRGRWTSQGCS